MGRERLRTTSGDELRPEKSRVGGGGSVDKEESRSHPHTSTPSQPRSATPSSLTTTVDCLSEITRLSSSRSSCLHRVPPLFTTVVPSPFAPLRGPLFWASHRVAVIRSHCIAFISSCCLAVICSRHLSVLHSRRLTVLHSRRFAICRSASVPLYLRVDSAAQPLLPPPHPSIMTAASDSTATQVDSLEN
ncbi:hypothetical protein Ahy_B08g091153 isoform B [Arachis hypogaea]|uniref:Uncharacterized protein n=1 Tax=Arachis hypogaea TaxID=3818 RepID=A0A444Y1H8_ARAHY|nr:hypothetical protein Ahy_B08g091153 isoform B [Arachis hypogaea]